MKLRIACVVVGFLSLVVSIAAQTSGGSSAAVAQVPPLIQFSSVASDLNGKPPTGVVGITFYLYKDQQGGSPLWLETQNVQPDQIGHYTVLLGSTSSQGLPTGIFASGEAHWLGVQVSGQEEQPRVLLLSVPYALKAGDAATIGGLPPSAFLLATPQSGTSTYSTESATGPSAPPPSNPVTGTGTVDFVPLWDSTSDIVSSAIFQSGASPTAKIGINIAAPAATLDVNGNALVRGAFYLPNLGNATAGAGFDSDPFNLLASSFNSGTGKAVTQTFQWQAEPALNDTAAPSATLNLLFGSGTNKPTETGLNIASNGQIKFATGQSFPGAGTITGVTTASGSGLTGGGTSGTLNLALSNTCAANQVLQWNGTSWACATLGGTGTITGVTAGTDLTGGGTSGTVTLNLDTTKVPQLAKANTFTATQTITGNLALPATNSGGSQGVISLGGAPFIYGGPPSYNAFLGGGILTTTSGNGLTAVGGYALSNNSSGQYNTALGYEAGASNTAGSLDTFIGDNANPSTNSLSNATAIGDNALVSESNALVLGCVYGVGLCPANVSVGIGTSAPAYTLDVHGTGNFTGAVTFSGGQTFPGVPSLGAANTFTATQTITATGNGLSATSSNSAGEAVFALNTASSGTNFAVFAQSTAPNSAAVGGTGGYFGVEGDTSSTTAGAAGVVGQANGDGQTEGVYGLNYSTTAGSAGVVGNAAGASGVTYGVYGENAGTNGVGVYGVALGPSVTGSSFAGYAWGVWGDTNDLGLSESGAVAGTADSGSAGVFQNNSSIWPTLDLKNNGSGGGCQGCSSLFLEAYGGNTGKGCTIDVGGTLNCEGTVTAVVPTDSGARKVSLYAVQSPENWFEDFGSGTLSDGAATITLDSTFTQTVNTGTEYHVFLTPNGDSKGLYVRQKTSTSFEVREQGGGHSSIAFDYRIVAKRNGYENVRLADVTEQYKKMEEQRELRLGRPGQRPVKPSAVPRTSPLPQIPRLRAAAQPAAAQPK